MLFPVISDARKCTWCGRLPDTRVRAKECIAKFAEIYSRDSKFTLMRHGLSLSGSFRLSEWA